MAPNRIEAKSKPIQNITFIWDEGGSVSPKDCHDDKKVSPHNLNKNREMSGAEPKINIFIINNNDSANDEKDSRDKDGNSSNSSRNCDDYINKNELVVAKRENSKKVADVELHINMNEYDSDDDKDDAEIMVKKSKRLPKRSSTLLPLNFKKVVVSKRERNNYDGSIECQKSEILNRTSEIFSTLLNEIIDCESEHETEYKNALDFINNRSLKNPTCDLMSDNPSLLSDLDIYNLGNVEEDYEPDYIAFGGDKEDDDEDATFTKDDADKTLVNNNDSVNDHGVECDNGNYNSGNYYSRPDLIFNQKRTRFQSEMLAPVSDLANPSDSPVKSWGKGHNPSCLDENLYYIMNFHANKNKSDTNIQDLGKVKCFDDIDGPEYSPINLITNQKRQQSESYLDTYYTMESMRKKQKEKMSIDFNSYIDMKHGSNNQNGEKQSKQTLSQITINQHGYARTRIIDNTNKNVANFVSKQKNDLDFPRITQEVENHIYCAPDECLHPEYTKNSKNDFGNQFKSAMSKKSKQTLKKKHDSNFKTDFIDFHKPDMMKNRNIQYAEEYATIDTIN